MLSISEQIFFRNQLNRKLKIYYVVSQILALIAVTCLLPILFIITLALTIERSIGEKKLSSPFWTELRYTQGRKFLLYKFASTRSDGKSLLSGELLKKIYLDELPQLFHIVRGEMAFVGPRPNPDEDYYRILSQGFYAKVIQRAGLTGGVQTAKGSDRHGDLSLDENYMNFCLENSIIAIIRKDLHTFFQTFKLMKRAEGI